MYNQNVILLTLYRFRFASQDQLRQVLGHRGHTQTSQILNILLKHQVVAYLKSRSIVEPSVYYLTPEGCRYLLANEKTFGIASIPRHIYRNCEASKSLVEHSQRVLDIYLKLKQQYGDELRFSSKVELGSVYPLKPVPDGEVMIDKQKYILEYFNEAAWKSLLRRRLQQLFAFWQLTAGIRFKFVVANDKQRAEVEHLADAISDSFTGDCEVMSFSRYIDYRSIL